MNCLLNEFIFSILISFIISIALWRMLILTNATIRIIIIRIWRFFTFQSEFRLITRRDKQRIRSLNVIWYSIQNSLYDIKRLMIAFLMFIVLMIVGGSLPSSFFDEYDNEWTQVWGLVFASIIAILIYDQSRIANEKIEYYIRRNNNLIHLQYSNTYHGKDYTKLQIIFAIDEILTYIDYWFDDVKEWGKEKNSAVKKKIQGRCDNHWRGIQQYNKILEDNDTLIKEFFDVKIVSHIDKISNACKEEVKYDYERNICKIEKLEIIIIQSLLLFKKWKIHTINRFLAEEV